jgi:hypothetical protein
MVIVILFKFCRKLILFQKAVPGLQEGAGLSGHLGGHRDHGGPRTVRQRSQECPYLHILL